MRAPGTRSRARSVQSRLGFAPISRARAFSAQVPGQALLGRLELGESRTKFRVVGDRLIDDAPPAERRTPISR